MHGECYQEELPIIIETETSDRICDRIPETIGFSHVRQSPTMAGMSPTPIAIGPKESPNPGDHATPLQQLQPMVYTM